MWQYKWILSYDSNRLLTPNYIQLNSITGDTSLCIIDTGILYDNNLKIEATLKDNEWKSYGSYFGAYLNESSPAFRVIYQNSNNGKGYATGGSLAGQSFVIDGLTSGVAHHFILDKNGLNIDGTNIANTQPISSNTLNKNILIGATSIPSPAPSTANSRKITIYDEFKIWKNDVLVFRGIPALRISDWKKGLYDTVTQQFFLPYFSGGEFDGEVVDIKEVFPNWKDDLAREYAFEQNQMFRRSQLSSAITFQRDDYDFIMNAPFGTKINVTLQIKRYEHSTFTDYWKGYFYHTDCTVNTDDKTIKVKPSVEDKYNKILAGLDKEFDLIKLKPACQSVRYQRRAMLQIYTKGESIVSCFMGGMSWEQEVTDNTISSGDLRDVYRFGLIAQLVQISIANAPTGLTDGFIGSWDYGRREGEWDCFGNNLGVYHMTYFQEYEQSSQQHKYTNGLRIYAVGTMTPIIWEYKQSFQSEFQHDYEPIPASFTLTAKQSGYTDLSASWIGSDIFGRWMVGYKLSGAYDVPDNDVVAYNRNYKYCIPYSTENQPSDIIRTTTNSSATNQGYGQKPDGSYYAKPPISYDEASITRALFPIGRTTWESWSIWLWWTEGMQNAENSLRTPIWLRDAYTIEAVISALLGEIDNTITFAADTNHSVFLYGTNPLTNDWGRLLITPKSNVIVAEYSQPAQKAPIKLNDVLQMLQKACGCYWYIDGSNRLRIEHISYFKNGFAYPPAARTIGWDLTTMECQRNGQKWSLGTGTYQYDKIEMPERYEFAWMDDTTNGFAGVPIEVLSGFVEQGKIEEINIAEFNSDIDYITLNPNDVSEDGFALMCAKIVGGIWQLGFDEFTINGDKLLLQNYQLAMVALQPAFLISDMPSWSIKVNGTMITAKGIQRKKKQQLNVPMVTPNDGNMDSLVKTTIGNGEIERASIKLTSRMTKFTLRYDTTEQ